MSHWIIEKSLGFTDVGLFRISESVRAYTYLILSLEAAARSHVIGNMASAISAQTAFLNNFDNIMNNRVDVRKDIKCYQDTLSYASSKVDYSMGEGIYMLPSDMNLNIRSGTAGYNNEILVSDSAFSLGKILKVDASVPEKMSYKTNIIPKHTPMPKAANKEILSKHTSVIMHEEERIALVLTLMSAFGIW